MTATLVRVFCPGCGAIVATVERDRHATTPADLVVHQRAFEVERPDAWRTWPAPEGVWPMTEDRPTRIDCDHKGCG